MEVEGDHKEKFIMSLPPITKDDQDALAKFHHEQNELAKMQNKIASFRFEKQLRLFESNGVPETPGDTAPLNNHIARSPVFSPVTRAGRKKMWDNDIVYQDKEITIRYTGKSLSMTDQDILLYAYRIARGIKPVKAGDDDNGTPEILEERRVVMNTADFVQAIGMKKSGMSYKRIREGFHRLATANFLYQQKGFEKYFRLIGELEMTSSGTYCFYVPASSLILFMNQGFAYVNMKRRKELGQPINLSKWLQSFVVSHAKNRNHAVSVKELYERSGYGGRLRDFRTNLKAAVDQLIYISELEVGYIDDDDDKMHWLRTNDYSDVPAAQYKTVSAKLISNK